MERHDLAICFFLGFDSYINFFTGSKRTFHQGSKDPKKSGWCFWEKQHKWAGVHSHGDPQNGWFISWIILWTNGWFRGTPISGNLRMNNIGYIGWWFQRLFWNFLKQLEKHHDQTSAKLLCGDFFFGKHWDITKKFEVVQIRSFGPSAFARNINHWVAYFRALTGWTGTASQNGVPRRTSIAPRHRIRKFS